MILTIKGHTIDLSAGDQCGIDGCAQHIAIVQRPDGRYRVTHGDEPNEEDVRFYSPVELYTTDGYFAFALERHAEALD